MPKASVNVQRGRLYLLARLPRKDGKPGATPQRIPTGLFDTPADHRIADRQRVTLQKQLDRGLFSWEDWAPERKATTWKKAIDLLYRKRVVNGRTGETTWQVSYMGRLRQLPMREPVTSNAVAAALAKYSREQCSYKELYYLLIDLCQLIGVAFPDVPVPTYSKTTLTDVPTDQQIIDWVAKSPPEFAWCIGMLAAYGLRPHEVDSCQFIDAKHRLQVHDKTKTGFRVVVPCHADWVELFELRTERRRITAADRKDATASWLFEQRQKIGFPWKPYALRHSYAGRLWRIGGSNLDIYTAARLMGHSPTEHSKTYRAFIDPVTIAERAEQVLQG